MILNISSQFTGLDTSSWDRHIYWFSLLFNNLLHLVCDNEDCALHTWGETIHPNTGGFMKTLIMVLVCAGASLALLADCAVAQTAEELFQKAVQLQEVKGELEQAIATYKTLVQKYPANQALAAKSLLRMGRCYEKLGKDEAKKAYERIIKEYASQPDAVAEARARLATLNATAGTGRGPVVRRILSKEDISVENLSMMKPSPDGRRVAYMDPNDGSILLRDLPTKSTEKLAEGLPTAFNSFPLFSPDGGRLAYLSATDKISRLSVRMIDLATREVKTVPGTEMPITMGSSHAILPVDWSRDGRFLLLGPATLGGDMRGSVGIMPASGGTITILADSAAGSASFSPDGRYVTFAAGDKGREQVFIQPVSGGSRNQISEAEGGNTSPFWSPDGRGIAYQRPEGIWLVPVADGKASGAPRLVYTTTVTLNLQAWTEAGGLYFTLYNDAKMPYQLAVNPATGSPSGSIEELPHHPTADPDFKWSPSSFAWSPNTQRIAFAGWSRHITIYAADGSKVTAHQVLESKENVRSLWWSKDEGEVLYLSLLSKGGAIVALDPVTGKIRELFPRSMSPIVISQSDDGHRKLAYYRSDAGAKHGLVVMETNQSEGKLVAPGTDLNGVELSSAVIARLSPQGDYVLFGRQIRKPGEGMGSLWIVRSDGTGLRKLGSVDFLSSFVWHPSGRFIAYTGTMGKKPEVFRIVEVASGVERNLPLPEGVRNARVTDWSRDGKLIGLVANQSSWEYWSLQALQQGGQ